ncbi:uncharacterized protein METZ01_LOCUS67529 [marine metagenome]|uniref:Uncharacterized protein n=1 Tax=marine metagenome TaxID=408172 RepID=A0A381TEV9_9ZZZZ
MANSMVCNGAILFTCGRGLTTTRFATLRLQEYCIFFDGKRGFLFIDI